MHPSKVLYNISKTEWIKFMEFSKTSYIEAVMFRELHDQNIGRALILLLCKFMTPFTLARVISKYSRVVPRSVEGSEVAFKLASLENLR